MALARPSPSAWKRSADLRERGRNIRLARRPADGEQLDTLGAGRDAASHVRADAHERAGDERMGFITDVQRRRPGERGVDLFLPVRAVVVLRKVLEVRREVLDLHAER